MSNVLKKYKEYAGWHCYVSANNQFDLPDIADLFKCIDAFPTTLKDERRSLVKLGMLGGTKVVAKQPRDKNRRKWMQFLSLLRPAEARKTFITLSEFKDKGIESLTPVCLLEKRRFSMVVDSWLLYEYREGEVSNETHLREIVEQLTLLHSHGYRHQDPNYGNFLIGPDAKMFLIDCRGKSRVGTYSDYYDFFLLKRGRFDDAQMAALIDIDKCSIGYWLARAYQGYITLRTAYKIKIGRKIIDD